MMGFKIDSHEKYDAIMIEDVEIIKCNCRVPGTNKKNPSRKEFQLFGKLDPLLWQDVVDAIHNYFDWELPIDQRKIPFFEGEDDNGNTDFLFYITGQKAVTVLGEEPLSGDTATVLFLLRKSPPKDGIEYLNGAPLLVQRTARAKAAPEALLNKFGFTSDQETNTSPVVPQIKKKVDPNARVRKGKSKDNSEIQEPEEDDTFDSVDWDDE